MNARMNALKHTTQRGAQRVAEENSQSSAQFLTPNHRQKVGASKLELSIFQLPRMRDTIPSISLDETHTCLSQL